MEKLEKIIDILGEENINKIKDGITDIILDAIEEDINDRPMYLITEDDINNFIEECKREAFKSVKDKIVNHYIEKLEAAIK